MVNHSNPAKSGPNAVEHDPALIDLIAMLIQSATGAALDPGEVRTPDYGLATQYAYMLADDFKEAWSRNPRQRYSGSMVETLDVLIGLPHLKELSVRSSDAK